MSNFTRKSVKNDLRFSINYLCKIANEDQSEVVQNEPDIPFEVVLELHQETVPFLYESFETALVECFPDIGLEMLIVLGAVISGNFLIIF